MCGNASYYSDITIISVAIQSDFMQEILGGSISVWYIDQIVGSRPYVIHVYIDYGLDKDCDYEYYVIPHCEIKISDQNEIIYFKMMEDEDW